MNTVNVLMSTYNGEKYLREQIDSIMNQKNVNVLLTIRDDGSTDRTVAIIKEYGKRFGEKIRLYTEHNIGFQRSFLRLLLLADKSDYYAFSDQDDVWKEDKLYMAIRNIETLNDSVALYVSNLTLVNEKMERIHSKRKPYSSCSLKNYYTRARFAGCTFLFTQNLRRIASRFAKNVSIQDILPSHDFVVASCAIACGSIYIDQNSYILHRRLSDSVTSGGNGFLKRVRTEWRLLFGRNKFHVKMADLTLKLCRDEIKSDAEDFLSAVTSYDKSFRHKCKLLFYPGRTSRILVCDIEQMIKILIGNY